MLHGHYVSTTSRLLVPDNYRFTDWAVDLRKGIIAYKCDPVHRDQQRRASDVAGVR